MPKTTNWKSAKDRTVQLLQIAGQLGAKHGADNVTRRMIADKAKVSEPLVSTYLGVTAELRKAVKRATAKELKAPTKAVPAKKSSKSTAPARATKTSAGGSKPVKAGATGASAASAGKTAKTATPVKASGPTNKSASAPRKRSIKEVRAIKDKAAASDTQTVPIPPVLGNVIQ